ERLGLLRIHAPGCAGDRGAAQTATATRSNRIRPRLHGMASRAEQTALDRRSGPPRGWRLRWAQEPQSFHAPPRLGIVTSFFLSVFIEQWAGDRQFESISLQRRD